MLDDLSLDQLLIGAAESPPSSRIDFRDPIARHGSVAVSRIAPWLADPALAAFAIRVIQRAAEFGGQADAVRVLRDAMSFLTGPAHTDAQVALGELGVRPRPKASRPAGPVAAAPMSTDELVAGRRYRRRDLHDAGLGGNRQKGISYGANGTDVLLFSDPAKAGEWGYRDTWQGADAYRYFGEWSGTGDMGLVGGNREIVDRSPNLYLFTRLGTIFEFAGRFQCRRWTQEPATRDGKQWMAIVFDLERV